MHLLTTLELSWKQSFGFAIFFRSKVKQDFAREQQIKQWQVWIHPSRTGDGNESWCLLLLADKPADTSEVSWRLTNISADII